MWNLFFTSNKRMRSVRSNKTQRLPSGQPLYKIETMKITKNIGMVLLALYLIIDGLLGFGLNLGPAIFLLYFLAIIAGILILLGK